MSKIKIKLKNTRGQVAIFALLMFSMIFMFFGMAINIGMLVHHKINLQNAADLAALSAAAEQARILNMIGWKNYELQKNWKSFMYNYWVAFNDRHQYFPDPRNPHFGVRGQRNLALGSGREWTQAFPGIAPSYCFGDVFGENPQTFKACEAQNLPATFATVPGGDAFIASISLFAPVAAPILNALENMSASQFTRANNQWNEFNIYNAAESRRDLIKHWNRSRMLYNTYFENRPGTLVGAMNANLPYETSNIPPASWHTQDSNFENQMPHISTPLRDHPQNFHHLAYVTALKNLNRSLLESVHYEELSPQNGYIQVAPQEIDFTVFYTQWGVEGARRKISPYTPIEASNFIVAIQKDPTVKTFYALKLTSTPFLPFLPGQNQWTLTAMAAAQPFGSRIGDPGFDERNYTKPVTIEGRPYRIPHMMVDENVSIDRTEVLHQLKSEGDLFEQKEAAPIPPEIVNLAITKPNRWDVLRYVFQTPETSQYASHPSDQIGGGFSTTAPTMNTSWANRAGYSIKLVPIQSLIPYISGASAESTKSIFH